MIARLPKILEINVNHPIILKIKENLNNKEKEEELNDIVNSEIRTIDGIEELRELIVMEKLKEEPLKVDLDG